MKSNRWHQGVAVLSSVALVASMGLTGLGTQQVAAVEELTVDEGENGMVSTSHPIASEVGAEMLERNANAVDTAIAIQFTLNVVEPMMSGIGGGGFMMVYDAEEDDTSIINSRERAPSGAEPDMFLDEDGNVISFSERSTSGDAVGVPGTLNGLMTANEEWGSIDFETLMEPAIELAEEGFEIDTELANAIANHQDKLSESVAEEVFMPEGEPLQEGDHLVQEDLAKTFQLIQNEGLDAFYNGEIGQALANTVQDFGGSMTMGDIQGYEATIDEPVWGTYQGYDIASMPPPSSGGLTLLQMLALLEGFDIGQYDSQDSERYHHLTEVMRLAYADRGEYMGDPEFVEVPFNGLLHPEYIEERRDLISAEEANENIEAGDPWRFEDQEPSYDSGHLEDQEGLGETTHFTVTDQWGNMVSYTSTIEQVFGTGIMVPDYGIMLNNELTDFDATPGGANEVQPNKRPLSSMTPTIIFEDGEPYMSVGSPGGPRIINAVFQVTTNVIDHNMSLQEAIEEPRIHSMSYPNITWEDTVPQDVRPELEALGHEFEESSMLIGNVQSILVNHEESVFEGVADPRRGGASVGFTLDGASMINLIERFEEEGEFTTEEAAHSLDRHLTAVHHYENQEEYEKVVEHMGSFQNLLDHQQENGLISEEAYEVLSAQTDTLIEKQRD
ncbi:gamma-glutamyltranspeptidase/glutathione hydrolase [Geomicrobium halophilum]|uniref:Glutathione hydrolase proenzyme n=1 Tax=Geomicrobium halophilum TaxID=549000 RepID=A0A841PZJ8_9BACL|nr:gamma-glutamyltransferase [Geomicrobium halophilum]MBB6450142.1 gamma-glutamyltranspeptidase/glutathione hydrolase [Geomicrobium halophilum]